MGSMWHRLESMYRKASFIGSRGTALVAVLWIVSLLATIVVSFVMTLRTEAVVAGNQIGNAEARALADAGFYRVVLELVAEGTDLPRDGSPREWAFADGRVLVSIQAEGGKVDLNGADMHLLTGLFAAAGTVAPQALANAVIDFRDTDDEPLPGGGEDADYRAAGLPHEAKDRPFERRDELLQVIGVTRELYDALLPAITVYTRSRGIDPTSAPPLALAALQNTNAQSAASLAELSNGLGRENPLSDSPYSVPSRIPVVTIRAEATTFSGAVFAREAVVALTPNLRQAIHVLTWEQGRRE